MSHIVLIACSSRKGFKPAKAADLYQGSLFRLSMAYARSLRPDAIYILSAKHGLLGVDHKIAPYNVTLNEKSRADVEKWAIRVLDQLRQVAGLQADHFTILAGERYCRSLLPHIKHYKVPLAGLGIGQQLKFLKDAVRMSECCATLHRWFNACERLSFPFSKERIPCNGIYILFEKGERAHGGDRIVRVGTHTGHNQLPYRLQQHFLKENKDSSIFRKNIGRALLSKTNNPFLPTWELDLTSQQARATHEHKINRARQLSIEQEVSACIRDNFTFVVFPVAQQADRVQLESRLISTISLCEECRPSSKWLGRFSPKTRIQESGLWQVNELYKDPLSPNDFAMLRRGLEC